MVDARPCATYNVRQVFTLYERNIMTSATIRLSEEEKRYIETYAKQKRRSMSDVIKLAIMDKIEDEYDLIAYDKAMEEHRKDPTTYSLSEVKERHGLA